MIPSAMNTTIRDTDRAMAGVITGDDRLSARLMDAIEAECRAYRQDRRRQPVLRQVRVAVPAIDPLDWLRARDASERMYWRGRDEAESWAAVGQAHVVAASAGDPATTIRATLDAMLARAAPGVRYVGGMRFDPERAVADEWRPFERARFVLPRFVLEAGPAGTFLACNLMLPGDADRLEELRREVERLGDPLTPERALLPVPVGRNDIPGPAEWADNINRAVARFEAISSGKEGSLEKVVLARRSTFQFAEALDPTLLLQRLQAATPHCFHFMMQFEPGGAFLGASPERLYRRDGRQIRSEAVAGTRPRGASPEADARLRQDLIHSDKDRREQDYVKTSIVEALDGLCSSLDVDNTPRVMELAKGRHLCSHIAGTLRHGVGDADILQRLHPTPAVGGFPREVAIGDIREVEHFDRGWYAGPVGWIGRDRAEFAVAIRSGQVSPRSLTLYAGAGIVRGSEASREWAEIEHKISDFLNVLGLDLRDVKY